MKNKKCDPDTCRRPFTAPHVVKRLSHADVMASTKDLSLVGATAQPAVGNKPKTEGKLPSAASSSAVKVDTPVLFYSN